MYQLVIDQDLCVCCRNCEAILPELLSRAVDGRLPISPTKLAEKRAEIQQAIASCHLEALTLKEVKGCKSSKG